MIPSIAIRQHSSLKNFLYAPNHSANEHHFDAMRMSWRACQQFLNDAFGQLSGSLILFLHNPNLPARPDIGSYLTVHAG
jgi:hypothetical protein